MKILALDSSGLVASAAIVEDDVLIAEYTTDYKKTHSQTLLPMLDEIRQMIDLDLHTIDAIAISAGPGSFTGLRIGAATAKGLGLALNLPLVEVPTLEGLAFNRLGTDKLVCPIMDARRNQVYTGIYEFCKEETSRKKESSEHQLVMHSIKEQCAIASGRAGGNRNSNPSWGTGSDLLRRRRSGLQGTDLTETEGSLLLCSGCK